MKLHFKIPPKNVAMAHTRPQRKPTVEVPKSQWSALNKKPGDLPYISKNPNFISDRGHQRANEEVARHPSEGPEGHTASPQQGRQGKMEIHDLRGPNYSLETLTQACKKGSLLGK